MRRSIQLSPHQPIPSLGWHHPRDRLTHEPSYWSIAASPISLNAGLEKRPEDLKKTPGAHPMKRFKPGANCYD
jgi:hypothetical protein